LKIRLVVILIGLTHIVSGQIPEYFGAGNDSLITVTSSSFLSDTVWPFNPIPQNTINGVGLTGSHQEATRFLMQATVGFEEQHVESLIDIGMEAWIDEQIALPNSLLLPSIETIYQLTIDTLLANNGNDSSAIVTRPNYVDFNYAWWDVNMKNDDLLRHRVATALSEIMVISRISALGGYGYGLGSYYDVLSKNALGNFETLLTDMTLHPMMGWYLTYINNPKTDTITGIFPDENFAREVMQLFTIGLVELNLDGTPKLDNQGNEIPTYTNHEVGEFAKIFTGLGYGDVYPFFAQTGVTNRWNLNLNVADMTSPMIMYEEEHEQGEKYLLNQTVVPAGQTGMEDIEDAISNIFNHPNVGPFIAYRLIQRLIKSNPTPQYIARVASIFNSNENGVRGDMASVVKAILLDEEARNCSYQNADVNSKLKEPFLRYSQFARLATLSRPNDNYWWNNSDYFHRDVQQDIMAAPSVFNFFMFNDAPNGAIKDAGLVAPEFQIHNTQTSVGYWNMANRWVDSNARVMTNGESLMTDRYVYWDKSAFEPYYDDPEVYLNWLDQHITGGSMSENTRTIIRDAISGLGFYSNQQRDRIWLGAYLALICPEANVMK